MSSLARCICVLDCEKGQDITTYECDICLGSGRKLEEKKEERLDIVPDSLLQSITERWRDKANTSAGNLLCSFSYILQDL